MVDFCDLGSFVSVTAAAMVMLIRVIQKYNYEGSVSCCCLRCSTKRTCDAPRDVSPEKLV